MKRNYSIDCYQNPKNKDSEIYTVFKDYSKFISREFSSKEEAMMDKEVTKTQCFLCKRTAKKKIRWFSVNPKSICALHIVRSMAILKEKQELRKQMKVNIM